MKFNISEKSMEKQIDELIAAELEEEMSLQDSLRKVNDLFIKTLKENEVYATILKEEMDALIAEQPEHLAGPLCKMVTKMYMKARKEVSELYNIDEFIEEETDHIPGALKIEMIKSYMKLQKFVNELYMDGQERYAALYVEKSSGLIKDKTEKQDRKP